MIKAFESCMRAIERCLRNGEMLDVVGSKDYQALTSGEKKFIDHLLKTTEISIMPESDEHQLLSYVVEDGDITVEITNPAI